MKKRLVRMGVLLMGIAGVLMIAWLVWWRIEVVKMNRTMADCATQAVWLAGKSKPTIDGVGRTKVEALFVIKFYEVEK